LSDHVQGDTLAPGLLFDSNRHTLACLLQSMGVQVLDMGIVGDNEDDTRNALSAAAEKADVVISSGATGFWQSW